MISETIEKIEMSRAMDESVERVSPAVGTWGVAIRKEINKSTQSFSNKNS